MYDNDSFVTIGVGPQNVRFRIHKTLLMHYSGYFRGALGSNFKEAREQLVRLDDESAEIFGFFKRWLYSDHIADTPTAEIQIRSHKLVELYLFGERRIVPELQDLVIPIIHRQNRAKRCQFPLIQQIYDNTMENSPLRNYYVQLMAHLIYRSRVKKLKESGYIKEFVVDVVEVIMDSKWTGQKGFDFFDCNQYIHAGIPELGMVQIPSTKVS